MKRIYNFSKPTVTKILFVLVFMFFVFVMCCSPYSSDDYEFASLDLTEFEQIFRYALFYGNGRLLGNIGAVFMVRHSVVNALVRALIITSVVFLIPAMLGFDSIIGYILSFILLTVCQPEMFGQVYTWTSGFYNYIPPIWMLLVVFYCLRRLSVTESTRKRMIACLAIAVLGVSAQLFVEHS